MGKGIYISIAEKKAIIDFFSGKLGEESKSVLENWLQESNANKLLFDELSDIWRSVGFTKDIDLIDVEKAWNEIQVVLFNKRESTYHLRNKCLSFAAIFFLVFLLSGIGYYFISREFRSLSGPLPVEYTTQKGSLSVVTMPDGTLIWLNGDTRLFHSNTYGSDNREVKLIGEAYFEVKTDTLLPFKVVTDDISIYVHGTKFMVTSYPNDTLVQTFLEQGSIELEVKQSGKKYSLVPGEDATYERQSKELKIGKFENPSIASWRYGQISFYNKPLSEIAAYLVYNYGVEIEFDNDKLKQIRLTLEFGDEEITRIMSFIEELANVKIKSNRNTYLIKGKT